MEHAVPLHMMCSQRSRCRHASALQHAIWIHPGLASTALLGKHVIGRRVEADDLDVQIILDYASMPHSQITDSPCNFARLGHLVQASATTAHLLSAGFLPSFSRAGLGLVHFLLLTGTTLGNNCRSHEWTCHF